jgi:hypothetical protein
MLEEEAEKRKIANLKQNKADVELVPHRSIGHSRDIAGEMLGVTGRYITEAKKIKTETPEFIEPFLRDLNALNDCYFDIVNKLGVIVDYPETLPLKDFLECFLKIDYSEYPKHPERITAKITRAKRQSKTIK